MSEKPIFCGLAFGAVTVAVMGDYRPCCNVMEWPMTEVINPDPLENINNESFVDLRRSLIKGEWPLQCNICKWAEELSGKSMRTHWDNEKLRNALPLVEKIDPKNVFYLDIALGNKCNSKCMTCGWTSSNLWEEEHTFITGNVRKHNRQAISYDEIKQLNETFPNVTRIQFIGGEPTIMSEHLTFLKELIDLKRSPSIELSYVTNLTGISDEMIELWKKFKIVHVSISIDGFDKCNDYIRYPISWAKVEKNLRRYFSLSKEHPDKFFLALSATVSLFNAHGITDLLSFWYDITAEYNVETSINVQRAMFPFYVDLSLLSNEYRNSELEKLKTLHDSWQQSNIPVNFNGYNSLIEWLECPYDSDIEKINKTKEFITKSDLFRKRSIKDFLPDLFYYLF